MKLHVNHAEDMGRVQIFLGDSALKTTKDNGSYYSGLKYTPHEYGVCCGGRNPRHPVTGTCANRRFRGHARTTSTPCGKRRTVHATSYSLSATADVDNDTGNKAAICCSTTA